MTARLARGPSIRRRLLIFLLPPLTALLALGALADYRGASLFARKAQDQRLADAVLEVAARIADGETASQALPKHLPPNGAYAISGPHGALLAGDAELARVAVSGSGANPSFADGEIAGRPMRIASYTLPDAAGLVRLAGGDDSRSGTAHFVLGSTWLIGFIQLDITLLLVWIGVHYGLAPLADIRREIESRSARELQPLGADRVPIEVRPLVDGLNLLFEMLAEAARAQRQFVADTAHQLRTPITGLLGSLDVLLREPAAAAVRERVASLHDGMSHLSRSANQLLALARAEPSAALADRFAPVDVKGLVERIIERNLDRSLHAKLDLGGDTQPAQVTGSARLLEDLLGNLVDNALHYTPAGGRVTVRCGCNADGQVYLEVEDDGPGIAPGERARVRERFYRSPGASGHGTGLGLAIVDEIARLHAANLTITGGAYERGTLIRVAFSKTRTASQLASA